MKRPKRKKINMFMVGIGFIVAAVATPFSIIIASNTKFTVSSIDKLGTVGDFFGGSTVGLLSLASICFLIHTIGIQKDELELTREEFITGNTTAKVQQVDNAFFNMLSLHHQIVNNIKVTYVSKTFTGREGIEFLNDTFRNELVENLYSANNLEYGKPNWRNINKVQQMKYIKENFENEDSINQDILDKVYESFQESYGNDIGHYMRNNYRIVKFIVNNVANDEVEQKRMKTDSGREPIIGDKRYYFGMLRAQWSNAEFELILINSLYTKHKKFKDLILKYDVLDIEESEKTELNNNTFILKNRMEMFKPYRNLIEIEKSKDQTDLEEEKQR